MISPGHPFRGSCPRVRAKPIPRLSKAVLLFIVVCPSLAVPASAEKAKADFLEFRGQVILPPDTLSRRARLSIILAGVAMPFRGQTWADGKGRFRFRDLTPGVYSLYVYIPRRGEILESVDITHSFADVSGRVDRKFEIGAGELDELIRPIS